MQALLTRAGFCFIAFVLSGCMVGPNFRSPPSPHVARYTETALPKRTVATPGTGYSGKAQTFIDKKDIPAAWWYLFHSPALNELIVVGMHNSPNLAAAYAALRVSQEALNVQIGNLLFPAFDANVNGSRNRASNAAAGANSPSSVFNLFNATVNVSYTLDVFGSSRRQIEALRAQVDYQQFQLVAAYLTLTSNIVTTSVAIASYQAQISATKDLIRAQANQLKILRMQFNVGGVPLETVLTQETLVDQTRATLPPLEKSLSISRHALSVLVGAFPSGPLPYISLDSLNLPERLPVTLPSQLVRQRPDVRASEALMHAAMANIGVATAALFPQVTLNGGYGWQALVASQLFTSNAKVWNMMASVAQPIFHGGALLANRRQSIAAYQQAEAQYRQTVLQAFQNVADALRAIEFDAKLLQAQKRAEVSAQNNMNLTQKQFVLGGVSYLDLLNAQQQYQQTRIATIQARAARYADTAALFQALGGGWWNTSWCVKEDISQIHRYR